MVPPRKRLSATAASSDQTTTSKVSSRSSYRVPRIWPVDLVTSTAPITLPPLTIGRALCRVTDLWLPEIRVAEP